MTQLLTVKNNQLITRTPLKNQPHLTAQDNTAFVIEQQAGQPLPQVQVTQDHTLIRFQGQESLSVDTWQTPELYLHTPEGQYKLVYGQWTPTDSFPLEMAPPQPLNESLALTQSTTPQAQLGGLIGSAESTGGHVVSAF